jgi:hypothetical protein
MHTPDNPKTDFLMALGRFVVCFSKIQNVLQEGIYVMSAKTQSSDGDMVRRFMHNMMINQLEDIFLTLATEYSLKCAHIDSTKLSQIRSQIASQLKELKKIRNKMMHSVWSEKFWEGKPEKHEYRMIYHKNKDFKFEQDVEEFNYNRLNELSKASLYLESYIHDFMICIADGDTQKDKHFDDYFEFSNHKAIFPRLRDIERFKNTDHYI